MISATHDAVMRLPYRWLRRLAAALAYRRVYCRRCRRHIGYVWYAGHRRWICPDCSHDGRWEAF